MLRKSLCLALSFCVFLTTMPAPVRAHGPGGDVAELEPEPIAASHPITAAFSISTSTPTGSSA